MPSFDSVRDKYVPIVAPLAPSQDTTPDQIAAFYRPTSIPVVRHSPLPVSALSAHGAASASIAQTKAEKQAYGSSVNLNQIPLSSSNQGVIPPIQKAINNLAAISFQGAWSASTVYSHGAAADYLGKIYISLVDANLNNVPSSSPTFWQAAGANTSVFLGAWSGATAYVVGNQVTFGGSYYISLTSNTNHQPDTHTSDWQSIATANNYVYLGAYNNATAYVVGNEVSFQGSFWICISNTTGNSPSTTSSFWTLLGTSVILVGAYSNATAYLQGNEVTNAGNVFRALQVTTGNAPPTPPATNAFWQLIGPSDLGSVPDGSSRFGQTASGLVYRPLTNPLSGHDAGANATANVTSFTMRTSSKGDISVNSGSVTALSYNTLYFIYYDDPTLAGGAVTYSATTTRETAINGTGRFFVGSVTTPAAGAADTIGNNDGGNGTTSSKYTVQIFSTAGTFTWTKLAGAQLVDVLLVAGGGGGGGGKAGSPISGGAGGGGGGVSRNTYPASFFNSTETLIVGGGGGGGANTGVNGVAGGNSSFGNYIFASGGGLGNGAINGNPGGGAAGVGNFGNGGAGANGNNSTNGAGGTQGTNLGAGGGGAGGSSQTVGGTSGGTGGNGSPIHNTTLTGGTAGTNPGGAGGAGTSPLANEFIGGPAGGGGGGNNGASAGGAGGSPTRYGGGGGGGGSTQTGTPGSGGSGAPGIAIITTYF